jgi:hypothetical protein
MNHQASKLGRKAEFALRYVDQIDSTDPIVAAAVKRVRRWYDTNSGNMDIMVQNVETILRAANVKYVCPFTIEH